MDESEADLDAFGLSDKEEEDELKPVWAEYCGRRGFLKDDEPEEAESRFGFALDSDAADELAE